MSRVLEHSIERSGAIDRAEKNMVDAKHHLNHAADALDSLGLQTLALALRLMAGQLDKARSGLPQW